MSVNDKEAALVALSEVLHVSWIGANTVKGEVWWLLRTQHQSGCIFLEVLRLMPPCMWTFLHEEVDRKPVESWLENRSNKHILSLGSYHTADEAVYANTATCMREAACKCHWRDICGRLFKHEILGCILQVRGPLRKLCSAEFWWVWTEKKEQCAVEQHWSILSEQKTPAHCFSCNQGYLIHFYLTL